MILTTRKLLAVTFVIAVVLFWMRALGFFELQFDFDQFRNGFGKVFQWAKSDKPETYSVWGGIGFVCACLAVFIGLVFSCGICCFVIGLAWSEKGQEPRESGLDLRTIEDFNPEQKEQKI